MIEKLMKNAKKANDKIRNEKRKNTFRYVSSRKSA